MAEPKEEQRRYTRFDPAREEDPRKVTRKAISSRRLKEPGGLAKNRYGKLPGKPRIGSDSNASRRTRGH